MQQCRKQCSCAMLIVIASRHCCVDHNYRTIVITSTVSYRGSSTVSRKTLIKDWIPWTSHGMTPKIRSMQQRL
ncbi:MULTISPECIES: hypothetical protein [unclassified Rickettsia]|uniref:hypothetical protein n=1 Tax=unclassified Rickettsia TaxID=114295 RepID=UPI003132A350